MTSELSITMHFKKACCMHDVTKGAFNNYVDIIFPFFGPLPPLRGQFLYPERGQNQTFFDPLPLILST